MQLILRFAVLATAFTLAACGGASLETRDVEVDESYTGGAVKNVLILALMEDSLHDSRVIIERGITNAMKAEGIDAIAGYTIIDSVDQQTADPDSFDPLLAEKGVQTVLFLDPIKLTTDFDPGEYAQRRSAYRALGMDASVSMNLIGQIAAEADAAKVVMNAGLWRPGDDKDLFNATYDINAPGNYDIDAAREYAASFAEVLIEDLRSNGLVN